MKYSEDIKIRKTVLAIDKVVELNINGSVQKIRMCAESAGLSPILVVQAGPGLALLHEVKKFQQRLKLEDNFLVCYWDQRGCGSASKKEAQTVSLQQQVADLHSVLLWLKKETGQKVIIIGISLGAYITLQAADYESNCIKKIIVISPDANTAISDASVLSFLQCQIDASKNHSLAAAMKKLGQPPYLNLSAFQLRVRLLADSGSIERGKSFLTLFREIILGMIKTYGFVGFIKAMRNMNSIQRKLLPELASLNLFDKPPHLTVPIHYIFGQRDPLVPDEIVKQLPAVISAPKVMVTIVPDAGHMVHFDQPEIVREIAIGMAKG